jgi:hypothetical protein
MAWRFCRRDDADRALAAPQAQALAIGAEHAIAATISAAPTATRAAIDQKQADDLRQARIAILRRPVARGDINTGAEWIDDAKRPMIGLSTAVPKTLPDTKNAIAV